MYFFVERWRGTWKYYLGGKYIDALTKIVTAKLSVNGI
jgi:hypothetical protein